MACTLTDIIALFPCLQCLSQKELIAVLTQEFALLNGKDFSTGDDLETELDAAKCLSCLPDKRKFEGIVASVGGATLQAKTSDEVRAEVKCLTCLDPGYLRALLLYEICQYFSA